MAAPKHLRRFTEEFRRQMVELHDGGKPPPWDHGRARSRPVGLCSRGIAGHAAGGRKDAGPVKSAFATVASP